LQAESKIGARQLTLEPVVDKTAYEQERKRERLIVVLDALSERGVTQQAIAQELGVTPQYVSDVKSGRKQLTELFARRLGEYYAFDYEWLMMTGGVAPPLLDVRDRKSTAVPNPLRLPVFDRPIDGNPWSCREWDGAYFELTGAAAIKAQCAKEPYVLRYLRQAPNGCLRRNDVILVSQEVNSKAEIHVVRRPRDLVLARKAANGMWLRVADDRALGTQVKRVGHCVGILWRTLSGK
jgi:transcriptional regulator with XRE-family HTH domain